MASALSFVITHTSLTTKSVRICTFCLVPAKSRSKKIPARAQFSATPGTVLWRGSLIWCNVENRFSWPAKPGPRASSAKRGAWGKEEQHSKRALTFEKVPIPICVYDAYFQNPGCILIQLIEFDCSIVYLNDASPAIRNTNILLGCLRG